MKLCIAATIAVVILCASSEVVVTVDPTVEIGPIKAMNAVNNGPTKARADQSRGNFADFQALRIPYARTHDSIDQATSNGHTVDISASVSSRLTVRRLSGMNMSFYWRREALTLIVRKE